MLEFTILLGAANFIVRVFVKFYITLFPELSMKFVDILLIVLFLVILCATAYIWYEFVLPKKPVEFVPINHLKSDKNISQVLVDYNQSQQFYPNMRFTELRISYGFDTACSDKKKDAMQEALTLIQDATALIFYFSLSDPEITVTCSQLAPEPKTMGHFVAGEGGPIEVLNTTRFALILKGKIALYREERCAQPNIALHELLHVLGFDHNNNPESILYPTLDCEQSLDSYLIGELNRLYSIKSAPELLVTSASATKTGRYLSFEVETSNQGLKTANNVVLGVYADNELVKTFDIETLEPGTRKILTVENVRVSREATNITFFVDPENIVDEIDKTNNKYQLVLAAD